MRPLLQCIRLSCLLFVYLLLPQPSQGAILLRVEQVGGDVQVSGSGSAITTDLIHAGSSFSWTSALTDAQIYAGPLAINNGNVSLYGGLVGPLVFGGDPGVYELPDSAGSVGDLFGINADDGTGFPQLVLPAGYISGTSLSGTSSFPNLSLAQIGLTPGQVSTWSWGSGANEDRLRLEVVPAPAPLLGALAAFRMARSLRRRLRR